MDRKYRAFPHPTEVREAAMQDRASGMFIRDVAAKHGVSEWAVQTWQRRYLKGRSFRGNCKPPKGRTHPAYDAAMPRVLDELRNGRSLHGVAVLLKLDYESLRRRVKRIDPSLIQAPRRRYIPVETKRAAVEDYLERGSIRRISAHYGVAVTSLDRWTHQYMRGELR